jgi:small-conductance mechanosensitive channel
MVQENERLHNRLAAAESARQAAMHEMKDVAEQCKSAKEAALMLEESEQALRVRVQQLESCLDEKGMLQFAVSV